jgi:RNA polymerase sigma-70 factor (ECF subfamily)
MMVEAPKISAPARDGVDGLVDHLFRRESGRLVATLTRIFGPSNLSLAEEVVQEALIQALNLWPFQGVPDRPAAWLATVAQRKALDVVRRESRFRALEPDIERAFWQMRAPPEAADAVAFRDELGDDQLEMMFTCCHPDLGPDARVALTLKTLGGFGVSEIARAFLVSETAVNQRLVRAKRRLRDRDVGFGVPELGALGDRLSSVLECLYLMFNEGYLAGHGGDLIREDVCHESLRLARLLAEHPAMGEPEVHALCALMMFQAAHFPARTDANGDLRPLAEQDRDMWAHALIASGFVALKYAQRGDQLSAYHIEAGIAACHAAAPSYDDTDWPTIRFYYNQLMKIRPSPVVALNRAVAIAMTDGPRAGLAALDGIGQPAELSRYALLPATRGEFHLRLGEFDHAASHFGAALGLSGSEPERRYFAGKLAACEQGAWS